MLSAVWLAMAGLESLFGGSGVHEKETLLLHSELKTLQKGIKKSIFAPLLRHFPGIECAANICVFLVYESFSVIARSGAIGSPLQALCDVHGWAGDDQNGSAGGSPSGSHAAEQRYRLPVDI